MIWSFQRINNLEHHTHESIPLRVLGIDPGLAHTGYGIIEINGSSICHLCHGVINTKPHDDPGDRLLFLFNELSAVVETYKPRHAGVEALFFAKNITSALPVAQARGVVLMTLRKYGIATREYTPQAIKQAIVGVGRAEKAQVQELVRVLLGLPGIPKPDHAADALAAAICRYNNGEESWFTASTVR